jgi:hypothetical protein
MYNRLAQYIFGFSFLAGRSVYRLSNKALKGAYKNLSTVLPFLSQTELLRWARDTIKGVDGKYDLAMDAEYLKTHIGGSNHRLFDGGHDPISAWQKVKGASDTDTFSQEVIGYVSGIWKDVSTPKGIPFVTLDKENYDKSADWVSSHVPGASKSWFYDMFNFDVFEIFSSALGLCGAIFFLKKNDINKLSEILGSMGIITILTANPLMGISVVICTGYAYVKKKKDLNKENAIKGAGYTTISLAIFSVLGLPVLIELIIVVMLLRILKKKESNGSEFIKSLFAKTEDIKLLNPKL